MHGTADRIETGAGAAAAARRRGQRIQRPGGRRERRQGWSRARGLAATPRSRPRPPSGPPSRRPSRARLPGSMECNWDSLMSTAAPWLRRYASTNHSAAPLPPHRATAEAGRCSSPGTPSPLMLRQGRPRCGVRCVQSGLPETDLRAVGGGQGRDGEGLQAGTARDTTPCAMTRNISIWSEKQNRNGTSEPAEPAPTPLRGRCRVV